MRDTMIREIGEYKSILKVGEKLASKFDSTTTDFIVK